MRSAPDWLTPCHRRASLFTNPVPGSPNTEAGKQMCEKCPILRQCAEAALHAGDSLDGCYTRPASGVIQAGVFCTGDQWTAEQLARIAGVSVPTYHDHIERNNHDGVCKGCGEKMGSWTRDPKKLVQGTVMHYARGYCTNCRGHYKAAVDKTAVESEPAWGKPRGLVCSKRRGETNQTKRGGFGDTGESPTQMSIF